MKKMDAYIAIRGSHNITELSDVPPDKMQLIGEENATGAGSTRQTDQVGRLALADSVNGAACRHEHRSV